MERFSSMQKKLSKIFCEAMARFAVKGPDKGDTRGGGGAAVFPPRGYFAEIGSVNGRDRL
jgi:hypothetical protein